MAERVTKFLFWDGRYTLGGALNANGGGTPPKPAPTSTVSLPGGLVSSVALPSISVRIVSCSPKLEISDDPTYRQLKKPVFAEIDIKRPLEVKALLFRVLPRSLVTADNLDPP